MLLTLVTLPLWAAQYALHAWLNMCLMPWVFGLAGALLLVNGSGYHARKAQVAPAGAEEQRGKRERVIAMTRWPMPGKCKTRLIGSLGPQGAADAQRGMTEHVLNRLRELRVLRPRMSPAALAGDTAIEMRFKDGTQDQVRSWLGGDDGIIYSPQPTGDLGRKLAVSMDEAFKDGCERVVVIGSDCPSMTVGHLDRALSMLGEYDVVIGPALDGGYYLLGTRSAQPALFEGIEWSTDKVLAQTLAKAEELGLSVAQLDMLSDIDRPEDLVYWYRARDAVANPKISVVIPTYNEAARILHTIQRIVSTAQKLRPDALEVIVVDGGSSDDTVNIVRAHANNRVRLIHARGGRASQLNAGGLAALGDVILFLHADTMVPATWTEHVFAALREPNFVLGAFEFAVDRWFLGRRLVEWMVNFRVKTSELPYGDQALFLRTDVFKALGGFPDLPLMEDVELVRCLRWRGRVYVAPDPVITSARRWSAKGVSIVMLLNWVIAYSFLFGVSPETLYRLYYGKAVPR